MGERDINIVVKRGLEMIYFTVSFHRNQNPTEPVDENVIRFWSLYLNDYCRGSGRELIYCFTPEEYRRLLTLQKASDSEPLFGKEAMKIAETKQVLMFPYVVNNVYALIVIVNPQNFCVKGEKCKLVVFSNDVEISNDITSVCLDYLRKLYHLMGNKVFKDNHERLYWKNIKIDVPNSAIYVMAFIELIYRQPRKFIAYVLTAKLVHRYSELPTLNLQFIKYRDRPYKVIHQAVRQFRLREYSDGYVSEGAKTLLQDIIDEDPIYITID